MHVRHRNVTCGVGLDTRQLTTLKGMEDGIYFENNTSLLWIGMKNPLTRSSVLLLISCCSHHGLKISIDGTF
jgi:hypothetical protein